MNPCGGTALVVIQRVLQCQICNIGCLFQLIVVQIGLAQVHQPHCLIDHQFHTSSGRDCLIEYLNRSRYLVGQRVCATEVARDHSASHTKIRALAQLKGALQRLNCEVEAALTQVHYSESQLWRRSW